MTSSAPEPLPIDSVTMYKNKTLLEYYSANQDTIGWLNIPDIKTDNIVMLGNKEGEYPDFTGDVRHYYMDHNSSYKSTSYGELYADYRCKISSDYICQNTTIYGHHMKDGTMLAGLDKYKSKSFFDTHQYIRFDTLWRKGLWRVFGVFVVDLKNPTDASFNYRNPEYATEKDFLNFVSTIRSRSLYQTGVDVKGTDRMLTLSTCTYPTGRPGIDNARLVVVARLATTDEVNAYYSKTASNVSITTLR